MCTNYFGFVWFCYIILACACCNRCSSKTGENPTLFPRSTNTARLPQKNQNDSLVHEYPWVWLKIRVCRSREIWETLPACRSVGVTKKKSRWISICFCTFPLCATAPFSRAYWKSDSVARGKHEKPCQPAKASKPKGIRVVGFCCFYMGSLCALNVLAHWKYGYIYICTHIDT